MYVFRACAFLWIIFFSGHAETIKQPHTLVNKNLLLRLFEHGSRQYKCYIVKNRMLKMMCVSMVFVFVKIVMENFTHFKFQYTNYFKTLISSKNKSVSARPWDLIYILTADFCNIETLPKINFATLPQKIISYRHFRCKKFSSNFNVALVKQFETIFKIQKGLKTLQWIWLVWNI